MRHMTSGRVPARGSAATKTIDRGPEAWIGTMAEVLRAAWWAAWIQRRSQALAWTAAVFLVQFSLRGGFTLTPAGVAWPYAPGTVITGTTPEPYLFAVLTPRIAVTLAAWSMVKWLVLAGLIGWAVAVVREAACCGRSGQKVRNRGWIAASGTSSLFGIAGGLVAVAGAAASCCGLLAVVVPAVAGLLGASLVSISPLLDAVVMVAMVAVIFTKARTIQAAVRFGQAQAVREGAQRCAPEPPTPPTREPGGRH